MQEMRRAAWFLALLACVTISCQRPVSGNELLVFAAASTADALVQVGRDFHAANEVAVRFSFGASRDLARQIRAGAPADVLVSADSETVDALVASDLVRPLDRRRIMKNRLVVIVPKESGRHVETPADLKVFSRIAIGDPTTVPAGIYAKKWLETAGVWKDLEDRIVPTLDVRAALAAVESGHAEAGVVYRTDATSSARARIAYEVSEESGPPITYVAARLARSQHPFAALFLDFLEAPQARATFAHYGFVL